jgi:hypothetical protein
MVCDWSFEAPDMEAAIKLAKDNLLTDYHPPEDIAVLWDDAGKESGTKCEVPKGPRGVKTCQAFHGQAPPLASAKRVRAWSKSSA